MARNVFLTGATGALGPHVLARMLGDERFETVYTLLRFGPRRLQEVRDAVSRLLGKESPDRIVPVAGDLALPALGLARAERDLLRRRVQVVVHLAADTRFGAAPSILSRTNVQGTRHVLRFAAGCRGLRQFLFTSTTCVAGTRTGVIPEDLAPEPPEFVNAYEASKWEAERDVCRSGLPVGIARLSTCIGDEHGGYVHRPGAFHHALRWIGRGLIPMVPGTDATPVDFVSTDLAAQWLAEAAARECTGGICHFAAGGRAVPLRALLDFVVERLASRGRVVERPLIVDQETFRMFRTSVERCGDALLRRVLETSDTFLPSLLWPKVYRTENAERCWGGPLPHPDWRTLLERVLDSVLDRPRTLPRLLEAAHA
jgi:nucleoside-diphosphate-sugar epimerase